VQYPSGSSNDESEGVKQILMAQIGEPVTGLVEEVVALTSIG
jgi:hypothetical protein